MIVSEPSIGDWDAADINWLNTEGSFGKLSYRLRLEQYAPDFDVVDTDATRDYATDSFDACIATYLIRAFKNGATLRAESCSTPSLPSIGGWVTTDLATDASGMLKQVSLVSDGNLTARLFYWDNTDIKYFETTDGGMTWGAAQTVGSVSDVLHLAATGLNTLHYIHKTSENNRRLAVYEYSGSWSSTESHIRWPIPVDQIDAERLDDGSDVLVMSADLPPLLSRGIEGTQLTWQSQRVTGLVSFLYKGNVWSDHHAFNVADRYDQRKSEYPRLSSRDGMVFITYGQDYGDDDCTEYATTACIRTKDGLNVELPAVLDAQSDMDIPTKLLFSGDYAYLVNSKKVARSPITAMFGDPADSVVEDISEYVLRLNTSIADSRTTHVTLSNPSNVLRGSGKLLGADYALQAVLDVGYWDGSTARRGPILIGDISEAERSKTVPGDNLDITIQDRLDLMRAMNASSANEWPSQQVGGDVYYDPTDTSYGGLRHTAPKEGSWTTEDGVLTLAADNEEGLAFTTLVGETWCGEISAGFEVTESSQGEYAGLVFWAQDKQHLWYAYYDADNDVIKLVRRGDDGDDSDPQDENTVQATSSAMGWSTNTTYYLKVVANYARVLVYSSTDGESWTEELDFERAYLPYSTSNSNTTDQMPLLSGHMGVIGLGYLDEPEYEPSPVDPPPPPEPIPDPEWPGEAAAYVLYDSSKVGRTWDVTAAAPDWEDISGSLSGTIYDIRYVHVDSDTIGAWAFTSNGIWWCSDLMASSPSWSSKLTNADVTGTLWAMWDCHTQPGYLAIVSRGDRKGYCTHTHDYGSSWTQVTISTSYGPGNQIGHQLCVDVYGGRIWVHSLSGSSSERMYYSNDLGTSWLYHSNGVTFPAWCEFSVLSAPFPSITSPMYLLGRSNDGTVLLKKSIDGGMSFSNLTAPAGYSWVPSSRAPNSWTFEGDHVIAWALESGTYKVIWSDDAGASWTDFYTSPYGEWGLGNPWPQQQVPGGWPGNQDIWFIPRHGNSGNNGGAGYSSNILLMTDDQGVTWGDKTGDWVAVMGDNFNGTRYTDGFPLPRVGANA